MTNDYTDGYKLEAVMGWVKLPDDADAMNVEEGTMGACVEALDWYTEEIADGAYPVICHFVKVDGNTANRV